MFRMTQETDPRPRPLPDETTRPYWDGAAAHRLVLPRCRSCTRLQFPPEVCCSSCRGEEFDHQEMSGRGRLYTWVVVDRPLHAGFVGSLPYLVALVELVEQAELRMITNLVEVAPGQPLFCGMPVEVVFEPRGDVTMPQFRPVQGAS